MKSVSNEENDLPDWWVEETKKNVVDGESSMNERMNQPLSFRGTSSEKFQRDLLMDGINIQSQPGSKPAFLRATLRTSAEVLRIPWEHIEVEIRRRRSLIKAGSARDGFNN